MIPLPQRMHANARGYFAFPLTDADDGLEDREAWEALSDHVEAAKGGHFDRMTEVLELYDRDADWVRRGAYVSLMGDAGPDALVERVHDLLRDGLPVDYSWDFAELLFRWGRLDAVPTIVDGWHASHDAQDAVYAPPRLSLLLEEAPDAYEDWSDDPDVARRRMLARHAELATTLGPKAFVLRGRELDLRWICERALMDLAAGDLDEEMRHKIEAMSGEDCSDFYRAGRLQIDDARAWLELRLAAGAFDSREVGQRCFFGHSVG